MSATAISPGGRKEPPPPRGAIAGGSRAAGVYRSVHQAVVEHRLPPGAKLTEEQLAAGFGVSRTIVPSALQALAHDHILTLSRHRGAFVAAPTVADAHDVFKGRKLVEAAIAREVARQIGPGDIAALRAILDEEEEAMRRGRADHFSARPDLALLAGHRALWPRGRFRLRSRRPCAVHAGFGGARRRAGGRFDERTSRSHPRRSRPDARRQRPGRCRRRSARGAGAGVKQAVAASRA